MIWLYKYITVFIAGFILGLIALYAAIIGPLDPGPRTLDTVVSIPTHTVTVTVKAQDKPALRKAGAIGKKTEQDPSKEVIGTGVVKDDSGTRTIAAVLDKKDGSTALEVQRPIAEKMSRHEFSLGYGFFEGSQAKAAQYRHTFGRIGDHLYGTLQAELFEVDRMDNRHPWNAMVFGGWRW